MMIFCQNLPGMLPAGNAKGHGLARRFSDGAFFEHLRKALRSG